MSDPGVHKKTVKQLREERGLSREELAVKLQTNYSTLVNVETGRSTPRVDLTERIYQFFGVPIGTIEWGKRDTSPKTKAAA